MAKKTTAKDTLAKEGKGKEVKVVGNFLSTEVWLLITGVLLGLVGAFAYAKYHNIPMDVQSITKGFSALSSNPPVQSDGTIPKGANSEGKPREAVKDCIDRHTECIQFQRNGECLKNPGWMIVNCPRSCDHITNACTLRDPKIRCNRQNLNISTDPIYRPGDLDKMFRAVSQRFGKKYSIKVLSESPWVVLFENFVSEEEGKALVSTIPRFERSTDTGSMNEYGETGRILSQGRTSSNGWCGEACLKHPKVKSVLRKIEEVTGVPRQNYESFQVLKYDIGQRYTVHHDYGHDDKYLACGPRILTFFLYLSDVEEGGETSFPQLGLAVKPKRGNAILWPSVLDSNPEEQDPRTVHEAKPVQKGLKVAANAWIHLYDYEKPNLWGCTGSFDEL